ncbi:MAG: EscU/YscU/HrcU family type III secretion system export apparatus switch protein [Pseudomonadota bacterium]|nr:EscU/YscU/HrcU family type III secretion system export apparatus switch protein [Pseudomonadota bacterium]
MKKPDSQEVAVALAYRAGQSAPQVVAKGRGLIAETIIHEARAHGIYVHKSAELVSLLMQVDLDQHIPPQLYRAVAEVLAWLYRLEANAALPLQYQAPDPGQPKQQIMPARLTQFGVLPVKIGEWTKMAARMITT